MMQNASEVEFNGEVLFSVEGIIAELQIARSSANLLNELVKNFQSKNLDVGVVAALTEMHGVLANSLALNLYEGEDTFNFAGFVDGIVVFGILPQVIRLKNGDSVKLVVSRRGDIFYVHGVLRWGDDLLMLPLMFYAGDRAFYKNCMKTALWATILLWVFFSVAHIFYFKIPRWRERRW